jgi:protein O-mannosyl-transferase
MSTALHLLLIWLAIKGIKNKSIIGFGISYYIITLSIVSNVVFPIGTNMSERFMFMPSLGFAMVLGVLLHQYIYKKLGQSAFFIAVIVILSLYGLKTFTRNFVWESDFKLFTTDVKTSVNSAKVLNAAGGALTTEASKEKDEVKKSEMLRQALTYLEQAVKIHPHYKNAYLIAGNAHYFLKEYEKSIKAYEQALKLDPDFKDAYNNLAVAYRDAGRVAGEIENNLQKSESYLTRSYQLVPKDATTLRLLGVVNGVQGKYKEALPFFEKVVLLEPNASGYLDLSNTYRNLGDNAKAEEQLQKALSLDPNILNKSPK